MVPLLGKCSLHAHRRVNKGGYWHPEPWLAERSRHANRDARTCRFDRKSGDDSTTRRAEFTPCVVSSGSSLQRWIAAFLSASTCARLGSLDFLNRRTRSLRFPVAGCTHAQARAQAHAQAHTSTSTNTRRNRARRMPPTHISVSGHYHEMVTHTTPHNHAARTRVDSGPSGWLPKNRYLDGWRTTSYAPEPFLPRTFLTCPPEAAWGYMAWPHNLTPHTHATRTRTKPAFFSCFSGARSRKLCWAQCLSVRALYSGIPCWS